MRRSIVKKKNGQESRGPGLPQKITIMLLAGREQLGEAGGRDLEKATGKKQKRSK